MSGDVILSSGETVHVTAPNPMVRKSTNIVFEETIVVGVNTMDKDSVLNNILDNLTGLSFTETKTIKDDKTLLFNEYGINITISTKSEIKYTKDISEGIIQADIRKDQIRLNVDTLSIGGISGEGRATHFYGDRKKDEVSTLLKTDNYILQATRGLDQSKGTNYTSFTIRTNSPDGNPRTSITIKVEADNKKSAAIGVAAVIATLAPPISIPLIVKKVLEQYAD